MTILDQESITWYSADAPPAVENVVMVFAPDYDEPVWLGVYEGEGVWRSVDAQEYEPGSITAWAPMPAGCAEDA